MAKRHKYASWRVVNSAGTDLATGFKTEAAARSWQNGARGTGLTVKSSVEYADCGKVTTGNKDAFCAGCKFKIPLTGEQGF